MTAHTVDLSGTDLPAGPSKGTLGFIAFMLLCLLPLSIDSFVALVGKASGVTGFLAYAFAWSASFAMGVMALVFVGLPALVLWHLVTGRRRTY